MLENADQIKQYPFVRILIPFIIGIILSFYIKTAFIPALIIVFTMITGTTFFQWFISKQHYSSILNLGYGLWVNLTILSFGLMNTAFHAQPDSSGPSDLVKNTYLIRTMEVPKEKPNSFELTVRVLATMTDSGILNCDERIILYFQKCALIQSISLNTLIAIQGQLEAISPPLNPNQFSYKNYMARQDIFRSAYIDSLSWKIIPDPSEQLASFSFKSVQQKLLGIYTTSGLSGKELALLSALTLGYKDLIDPEMKTSFSSSGTIHVLAVSGLHVGIIFLILKTLFSFLNSWRRGPVIRYLFILTSMWFYALLTGFTPSVIRATLMFSFLLTGQLLKRDASSINIIAASAFFILLFDPYTLKEVGFQFSYLAVLGIIYFHPKIYHLVKIRNWVLDKIWSLTVVSLSAQIIIAPLSIHYFNQFPLLFLVANLIVIPGITILLYLGASMLVLSFIPLATTFVSWLVSLVSGVIFFTIDVIDALPFSMLDGIYLSMPKVITMYLILLLVIGIINTRRKFYVFAFLSGILVFSMIGLIEHHLLKTRVECILLADDKSSVLHIMYHGEHNLRSANPDFSPDEFYARNRLFFAKRGISKRRCKHNEKQDSASCFQFHPSGNVYLWNNYFIIDLDSFDLNRIADAPLDSCFLIVSNKFDGKLANLPTIFKDPAIIFDPGCPRWKIERWKEKCVELGLEFHDMKEDGAVQLVP